MIKKGDTLIEVVIAVGIFSLIAVGVVSVVSNSSSGAQISIETTLTREEIDMQAEALRFIQAGYLEAYNGDGAASSSNPYVMLWNTITDNALESDKANNDSYPPDTCMDLYKLEDGKSLIGKQNAFVINVNALNSYLSDSSVLNSVYVAATNDSSTKLVQASTYPHLIFKKNAAGGTSDQDTLSSTEKYDELYHAEGIYVVAVKSGGTTLATAYYDFYIRSCWYGTGDKNPSTISTVIRLADPTAVSL